MKLAHCFLKNRELLKRAVYGIVGVLVLTAVAWANGSDLPPPGVTMFSPQGEIKGVRQVVARFSQELVSFGGPRLEDPFTIECPAIGKGRWADGRNWVYDFDDDLKAGVECIFTLRAGLKTLGGNTITGERVFSFNTGGPQVTEADPRGSNEGIVEDQVFLLTLDGEVQEDSVAKHVFCYLSETKEKVGVRVLGGRQAEAIIKSASQYDRDRKVDRIAVQCLRPFADNSMVDLIWGKSILSKSGIPSSREQVFHYKTREPFTATFHCGRDNPQAQCNPFLPVSIEFSSDVPGEIAAKVSMRLGKKVYKPRIKKNTETVRTVTIEGPFREKSPFIISLPQGIKDDGGRHLSNGAAYPLTAMTDAYPPLAKFSSRFGIIEQSEPVLPVTVRNIGPYLRGRVSDASEGKATDAATAENPPVGPERSGDGEAEAIAPASPAADYVTGLAATIKPVGGDLEVIQWLQRVASVGRSRSLLKTEPSAKKLVMPRPLGQKAFEVMGIPFKKPGLYVVELESTILGASYLKEKKPMYVHTAALVTNMSAHFKWGHESSIVWVTSLDKGEPVEGATVAVRDCFGKLYWEGKTDRNGIAHIDEALPEPPGARWTRYDDDARYDHSQIQPISSINSGYFVFAKTGADMTFVHSSWDKGIESYRFKLPYGGSDYYYWHGDMENETPRPVLHTIFDRTLFRAGETVHMKLLARRATKDGFTMDDRLPPSLTIQHAGSDEKFTLPLSWDTAKGVAEITWEIPQDSKLGSYRVYAQGGRYGQEMGEFKVEQFKLPLMKAALKPLSDSLVNTTRMDVDVMAEYLSGGAAMGMPVKLRVQAGPKEVTFDDYEHYCFSRGAVKEGIRRREAGSPYEYAEDSEGEDEDLIQPWQRNSRQMKSIKTVDLTLGEGGMARTTIDGIPRSSFPLDLMTEMEFKDPNGKVVTVSKKIPVWPSKVIIGVQTDDWVTNGEVLKVKALALDLTGKPMAGVPVRIAVFQMDYYSHRKKLVGGFYAYENATEIKRTSLGCEGTTNGQGLLFCEIKNPLAGSLLVEAVTRDEAGNVSATNTETWVANKEQLWFDPSNSDRIDLIPDKQRYEPGDKALFQVRMPMREATALITVEREGIIDSFVTKLSGTNPSVEIPIKGSYAPNIFVSALCVRGRTGAGKPTAFVDLAKPTFKLGITGVSVGWRAHELKVNVVPDRNTYKIREKARFAIKVKTADGRPLPAGSEVAFAVVDDSLLEIMPNESWNLLERMMQKRPYLVSTSTAQMQVVGRRHYGLKALPFGGGGGRQITRELFDTLILWKGRLMLDEKGEAHVEATLNDALTSFTAVAVATGGPDLFGTGRARVQSTQDLMILSGLSDVVREGDRLRAVFTLRNTTDHEVSTETKATVTSDKGVREMPALRQQLKAGEAREVGWDVAVPMDAGTMKWEVALRDLGGEAHDSLKVTQKVAPIAMARVVQASIARLDEITQLSVEKPKEAASLKGGLRVSLIPKLSGDVSGIIDYMVSYPYDCFEQRLSKAVALQDRTAWQGIVKVLPGYMDGEGLLKYFPTMEKGDDALTSYFLAISHEACFEIPDSLLTRLEEGLRKFLEGRVRMESPLARPDLTVRKLAAIEALSRHGLAHADYLQSIEIQPSLWPTSAVLDWANILKRVDDVPEREKRLKETEQVIRSRLNFQGTRMGFSTEQNDYLWWLMINGDVNAIRTILTFLDNPAWKEDMPRLVRGAVGRQWGGRWCSTVANAWGRVALMKFSDAFEAVKVDGVSGVELGKQRQTVDWKEAPAGIALMFSWPAGAEKLTVKHDGPGKPWLTVQSLAAVPLKEPVSTGFKVKKTYTAVDRKKPGVWSIGDVVRVRLDLEAQADMTWVVVNDPIPAGMTILGTGLGRDSTILTAGEKREGWAWPAYEERSFEAFKAYYWYVPKGKWSVDYTMRVNTAGTFLLPETRIEALYAPEMFGAAPNSPFEVE